MGDFEEEQIIDVARVHEILNDVTFAPSCVDMAWKWDVSFIGLDHSGWMIRCSFQRPDRETGVVSRGFGRWWPVPFKTTVSSLVKTAFAAAKMNIEHELMEAFRYKGVRIFDPHHTVEQLMQIGRYDG